MSFSPVIINGVEYLTKGGLAHFGIAQTLEQGAATRDARVRAYVLETGRAPEAINDRPFNQPPQSVIKQALADRADLPEVIQPITQASMADRYNALIEESPAAAKEFDTAGPGYALVKQHLDDGRNAYALSLITDWLPSASDETQQAFQDRFEDLFAAITA